MIDRRTLVAGAAGLATLSGSALAQRPTTAWPPAEHFPLWPRGRIPNAPRPLPAAVARMEGSPGHEELHLTGVAEPVVGVYRPANPDGRALLALPGGGYQFISVENEGINVARTFCPLGVTVFVLAYRLPGQGWLEPEDVPLQDGQRAMRLIRANAARYGIDPAKLGCVGFSAGGLLSASMATAYDDPVYGAIDAADTATAKPAFAGLIYPVTSGNYMRVGKRASGRFDAAERVHHLSTVPLFIVHALDDPIVPLHQPMAMLNAAHEAGIPVEAHFFERGGHGFGPAYLPRELPGSRWPELFDLWMRTRLNGKPT